MAPCPLDRRRDEILKAAASLFCRYGARKTTMAEVAKEAGVGTGTLYLEFPSKEALLGELSAARHEEVLCAMRARLARSRRPEEALTGLFEARLKAFLVFAAEGKHTCELVHAEASAVADAFGCYCAAEREVVEQAVRWGIAEGCFAEDLGEPAAIAEGLLLAYSRFAPPALFASPPKEPARALRVMHMLVLEGLLAR